MPVISYQDRREGPEGKWKTDESRGRPGQAKVQAGPTKRLQHREQTSANLYYLSVTLYLPNDQTSTRNPNKAELSAIKPGPS